MKYQTKNVRRLAGFTLIELLITLVIVAIVLGIGLPSFTEIIRTNQTVTQTNKFTRGINFARSEAVRRGVDVVVCKSSSGAGCTAASSWQEGWIVFADNNGDSTVNGADEILQIADGLDKNYTLDGGGAFASNVAFEPSGALRTGVAASTFTICRPDGDETLSRDISVGVTGRVSISIEDACP